MSVRFPLLLLLLPISCSGAEPPMPRVEVNAPDAMVQRGDSPLNRSLVGRKDLAAYGDSNLLDVLKRQPGIAIVGGEARMRGLGAGYTRIMIDGEPAPQGFTLDTISPELVERIEIARSPSADQSTGAVAGSINIILRKRAKDTRREDTAAVSYQHGHVSPSLSTQLGGRSGPLSGLLRWSLNATLDRSTLIDQIAYSDALHTADGKLLALRSTVLEGRSSADRINLAPRLQWSFDGGASLTWHTLATATRSHGGNRVDEIALFGAPTLYPHNRAQLDARTSNLRSELAWAGRIGDGKLTGGKLSINAILDAQQRDSAYVFDGERIDRGPGFTRRVDAGADERLLALKGKYLLPLGAAHSLAIGWDAGRTHRDEYRHQRDSYADGAATLPRLQDYSAVVERLALFAQDEWEVNAHTQAYVGVRWEMLRTLTRGADIDPVRIDQSVVSPVAQLLWKLPERQQVRLALARTYKAPLPRDLVPRRFTINNDNNAINPDFEGNPGLRPELSWGLDAAYERAFGKDGMVSFSGYLRRVSDVTVQQLYRDGANWVTRPLNNGAARVAGIEFDIKAPLTIGAAQFDLRMNLARNWSRVEAVAGPDNRLAEQVPLTANLGVDQRSAGGAWSWGSNLSFQGSGASVTPSGVREYRSSHALLDVNWSRKLGQEWLLRVAALNALGRDRVSGASYRDADGGQRRAAASAGFPTVRVTLKHTL